MSGIVGEAMQPGAHRENPLCPEDGGGERKTNKVSVFMRVSAKEREQA